MNDLSEGKFFKDVATAILREGLTDKDFENYSLNLHLYDYYALCFSSSGDDLYQWQAYGNMGAGFAIGYDPDVLCRNDMQGAMPLGIPGIPPSAAPFASANPKHTVSIADVVYANERQLNEWAQIIRGYCLSFKKDENPGIIAANAVMRLSAVCKDSYFSAEKERRLLYAPMVARRRAAPNTVDILGHLTTLKWRQSRFGLAPYFEYKGSNAAIREIVIGPSNVENTAGFSYLSDFLLRALGNVDIVKSKIPLR